jgi:hypothetical protein
MADELPSMPDVTPGDGIGAATVTALLALAPTVNDSAQVACIASAALVAVVSVVFHQRLRAERNETARTKIAHANQPVVLAEDVELDEDDEI